MSRINAGMSTCPICHSTWLVTPARDCLVPACGCFGHDVSAANPSRPHYGCGLTHAMRCEKLKRKEPRP